MDTNTLKLKSLLVKEPIFFSELLDQFPEIGYRDFLAAWGKLRESEVLNRDKDGRYSIAAQ